MGSYLLSLVVIMILRSWLQKPPFDERMVEVLSQARKLPLTIDRIARLTFWIARTTSPIGL